MAVKLQVEFWVVTQVVLW